MASVPTFIEIGVPSGSKAAPFYEALFGWTSHPMGKDACWLQTPTLKIGVHPGDETSTMVVYFGTEDIEADAARVRELGGEAPEPGPEEPGFGRFVECRDPQGVRFGLHQATRS